MAQNTSFLNRQDLITKDLTATSAEKNTFNNRVSYNSKRELSAGKEWYQIEAEWNAEHGEKDVEELKKKNESSMMNFQQETLDLVLEEKIFEWPSEEVVLTENQHKLDKELLTALSSINCSYLELHNASDFTYDSADTQQLEEFLNANKSDPDL